MNPKVIPLLAAALLAAGCCYGERTYVQPVGPVQALTVRTTSVVQSSESPDTPPRVVVTRHYMGPRPSWCDVGYYLPEPTIVRTCTGSLYVEEYVWGYPPPAASSTGP